MTQPLDPSQYDRDALLAAGSETLFARGLLSRYGVSVGRKPVWDLRAASEVVEMLRSGRAAVNEGQFLHVTEDGVGPLSPGRSRTNQVALMAGPSTWRSRRRPGESWSRYVDRCAKVALAEVKHLVKRAGNDRVLVDLCWVTEDELALFEVPRYLRAAVEHDANDYEPFLEVTRARNVDAIRVRIAGAIAPGSFYGSGAEDLEATPRDARFLDLNGKARGIEALARFTSLENLRVQPTPEPVLRFIGRLAGLRLLSLYEMRATNLEPLSGLRRLTHLFLNPVKSVELSALIELPRLRVLCLALRRLDDLSQAGTFSRLGGLALLTGGPGAPSRLPSLEPLADLTALRYLHLGNLRLDDPSLTPITRLGRLGRLDTPNRFPLAEFAKLAVALPNTAGPHRSPFVDDPLLLPFLTCPKCQVRTMLLTLGKPSRQLCPECDAGKVRKHVARWEIHVSSATAHRRHRST